MNRAIMCRPDGLTPAEVDALHDSLTRPRPDMAFTFDDAEDAKKPQARTPEAELIEGLILVAAGVVGVLAMAGVIIALTAAVQFMRIDIQTLAPTAAEVSAPGFDLEAKVAEVQP